MLRVADSGEKPPVWHLSASAALAERHRAGLSPDTLRFQVFPPCALLGRHQVLTQEIDAEWCAAHGVTVARRVTGGGAIVMAPGILGWELLLPAGLFPGGLGEAAARICTAAAAGVSSLGVDARFRPRNDIEAAGRKIGGTGGYFDGPTLLYQGTVIVTLDRALLRDALRWPGDKLARHDVETIEERVTDLAALLPEPPAMAAVKAALADALARELGYELVVGELDADEVAATGRLARDEIGDADFIAGPTPPREGRVLSATRRTPGGALTVHLKLRPGGDGVIEAALFTGDGFVNPPRVFNDLEAALKDAALADCVARARDFLQASGASFLGCAIDDVTAALGDAIEQ